MFNDFKLPLSSDKLRGTDITPLDSDKTKRVTDNNDDDISIFNYSSDNIEEDKDVTDTVSSIYPVAELSRRTQSLVGHLNEKIISDVKSYRHNYLQGNHPPDLGETLNDEQMQKFLDSDKGKEVIAETGLDTLIKSNGSKVFQWNGNKVSMAISKDGTLRIEYTEKSIECPLQWYQPYTNTFDFKLNDDYMPKDNNETDKTQDQKEENNVYKYSIDNNFIDLENKLKENGIETQIYADTIQTLIRNNESENAGEISENETAKKLEQLSGKKLDELTFFGNNAHYIDEEGIEHQFYYDNNSGEFISVNVMKNDNGGYDVEVNLPGNKDKSDPQIETENPLTDKDTPKTEEQDYEDSFDVNFPGIEHNKAIKKAIDKLTEKLRHLDNDKYPHIPGQKNIIEEEINRLRNMIMFEN